MQNQNQPPELRNIIPLTDRRLISIVGPDAMDFLQNVMTADMRQLTPDNMLYGLLLTPQGQFLHDFFVSRQPALEDGFLLDIFAARLDDLMIRLKAFKLRARAEMRVLDEDSVRVYAHPAVGLRDPRCAALGFRLYSADTPPGSAGSPDDYIALCTRHAVPDTPALMPQKDFVTDMNLDLMGAIAWDKGCYIGQEVTARMHYKGLAKKRLMIVEGKDMAQGDMVFSGGRVVGEIRQSNPLDIEQGLAIVRLDSLATLQSAGGRPLKAIAPSYLDISDS
ncbi:MAG: YgfZ/GcvT domain-containing protein [Alphaproteobacteria bacterium]